MMNERIKQLLGQAYDEAVPETWTTLSSEQQGRVYEKFAELIVRECANVADENYIHRGSRTCGLAIRLHFGVEE
jgi:hypothetical protein